MTEYIGQKVDIGNLSFSPAYGIDIHDLIVENPEGFEKGHLLRIGDVSLQMKYAELAKGLIAVKSIDITGPELTLMRDKSDRLNISDKLKGLLSKKGTSKYKIDELNIRSGIFDMDKDKRYYNDNISITLHNLSTEKGTKTSIEASASSPGRSKFSIRGWTYLSDVPKKLDLSAAWSGVPLSLFVGAGGPAEDGKAVFDMSLHAEGDTKSGIALKSGLRLKRARFAFFRKEAGDITIDADVFLNLTDNSLSVKNAVLQAGSSTLQLTGVVKDLAGTPSYNTQVRINAPDLSLFDFGESLAAGGSLTSGTIIVRGRLDKTAPLLSGDLRLTKASVKYGGIYAESGETRVAFEGLKYAAGSLQGSMKVKAARLSVSKTGDNRKIIKDASLDSDFTFRGRDLLLKSGLRAGNVATALSGTVTGFMGRDRSARLSIVLPATSPSDIRSVFWDVFPDSMLYAGLSGTLSANVAIGYGKAGASAEGVISAKDVSIEGENGEYSIGPINGTVPFHYGKNNSGEGPVSLPSFERSEFKSLNEYYARLQPAKGSNKITVGSLRYGFRLLDDIEMWIRSSGSYLNIDRFGANIFGGKLNGSATVDISHGLDYRAGLVIKGISLTKLCEDIEPIKGYISGKVDGTALIKGSSAGLGGLIGRADFWAYSDAKEKTKISREFLQKMGGPSVKAYLGERPFDKGLISLYLQNGFLIFKELQISHKNLIGITDLSVKVAPFNNRIAIDHLMSTIAEAAQRAKEK